MTNYKSQTKISLLLKTGLYATIALGSIAGTVGLAEVSSETKAKLLDIAKERKLSAEDLAAAAATYTSAKQKDEFICANSGGQAASVIMYAVPSMRILKYVPTGAPDSAEGFNFDFESKKMFSGGSIEGQKITWGDTHHPGFSETDGKYDGRYLFINDKANPRIFVIDLKDFQTKQIVTNPIFRADHGGAFVTPNTEYVIEGSQYASTPDRKYYPLTQENFNKHFRGGLTFHKFDKEAGRIDEKNSFTVLAPPYTQDLSDAGKGESYGFTFTNSFCSERYIGGSDLGRPPYEAGCSSRDVDYLHIINWKRAEEVIKEGKAIKLNGHTTIPLEVAAKEGVLFLAPEPKSPHGADVSPDGRYIVVAGKLDTHATVFDIRKIKELIAKKDFADHDDYGVPILDLQKASHGQVDLGLGPLHTQFDSQAGFAYTSIYIDSMVAKWDYINKKVIDKLSVHYNIGHLVSMQGDSQDPRGKYVIALNKLAIDRFDPVGPLHPQNHQLIDTSGEKMKLLYDMPLPMGEPHYTVCIDANTLKPIDAYPVGTDPMTMKLSPFATVRGKERVERKAGKVDVYATLSREGLKPLKVDANQGDEVNFYVTNVESTPDETFKFAVGGYNVSSIFPAGKTATLKFKVTQAGVYSYKADRVADAYPSRRFGMLSVKPVPTFEAKRKVAYRNEVARRTKLAQVNIKREERKLEFGQAEFESYGCVGCHIRGKEVGGPDLNDVAVRRTEDWLEKWIVKPEDFYNDPSIAPLIAKFGVKMPNQGVKPEEAKKMVAYLKTWRSQAAEAAPAAASSEGEKVYNKTCFACHAQGVGGAPKVGDKGGWEKRIAQGRELLFKHAIEGYQGSAGYMPAKGTCMDCSNKDIEAAVDFMIGKAK